MRIQLYISFLLTTLTFTSFGQQYRAVSEISAKVNERKVLLERGLLEAEIHDHIAQFDLKELIKERFTLKCPNGGLNYFRADTIIHRKNGLVSWMGKNINDGSFVNYVINTKINHINGNITLSQMQYELFGIDEGTGLLIDQYAYKNMKCSDIKTPVFKSRNFNKNTSRMASQDCNLRLLFAYTPNSKAMIPDMAGYIQARVDYTNIAYDNSNIDFHAEVAFVYETNYDDSDTTTTICWADGIPHPDKLTDLCNFHHVSDAFMPEVHEYRDQYRADICLFIDSQLPGGTAGQAFLPPIINAGEAFALIAANSPISTTAHEIGHTQGCHHDYANDPTATDNHGYVHIGATAEESFRTVMAYTSQCVDQFGKSCQRIPYFSDPDIYYNGQPVGENGVPGISGAKNAINIMNQKSLVNGFRDYPAINTLPATTLPGETFAYSIASTEVGNLTTYVIEDSSEVHFSSEDYITLRPGFQSQEGAFFEGRIGADCDPVNVNPGALCEEFGYSVDIDDTLAIIGAPRNSDFNFQVGAVYLYERISGIWQLKQTLHSPFISPGARYGHSVAIHDSLIVVGAPYYNGSSPEGGRVFVYEITDTTINRIGNFINVNTQSSGDLFGYDVDVFNKTIVVGSPGDTHHGLNSGSITIFTRLDSTWAPWQEIFFPGIGPEDRLGESVAIYGDYILAGVPGFDSLQPDQGKAVAYRDYGSSWLDIDELYINDLPKGSGFGLSVDLGPSSAIVGAPYDNSNGIKSGSVHFYTRGLNSFTHWTSVKPSDLEAYDEFGYSVALDGSTALISAPGKGSALTEPNKVYHYNRKSSTWRLENTIQQPSPIEAKYGHAIALSDTISLITALGDYPTCDVKGEAHSYIQAPNGFWIVEPNTLESARQVETSTSIRQDEGIRRE